MVSKSIGRVSEATAAKHPRLGGGSGEGPESKPPFARTRRLPSTQPHRHLYTTLLLVVTIICARASCCCCGWSLGTSHQQHAESSFFFASRVDICASRRPTPTPCRVQASPPTSGGRCGGLHALYACDAAVCLGLDPMQPPSAQHVQILASLQSRRLLARTTPPFTRPPPSHLHSHIFLFIQTPPLHPITGTSNTQRACAGGGLLPHPPTPSQEVGLPPHGSVEQQSHRQQQRGKRATTNKKDTTTSGSTFALPLHHHPTPQKHGRRPLPLLLPPRAGRRPLRTTHLRLDHHLVHCPSHCCPRGAHR